MSLWLGLIAPELPVAAQAWVISLWFAAGMSKDRPAAERLSGPVRFLRTLKVSSQELALWAGGLIWWFLDFSGCPGSCSRLKKSPRIFLPKHSTQEKKAEKKPIPQAVSSCNYSLRQHEHLQNNSIIFFSFRQCPDGFKQRDELIFCFQRIYFLADGAHEPFALKIPTYEFAHYGYGVFFSVFFYREFKVS